MEDLVKFIGRRIKQLREQNSYSQNCLSKLCGLNPGWISRLEKCKRGPTGKEITPSIITLQKLAKGLGVKIEDLIKTSDKKIPALNDTAILKEIRQLLKKQNNANKHLFIQVARRILR